MLIDEHIYLSSIICLEITELQGVWSLLMWQFEKVENRVQRTGYLPEAEYFFTLIII